jgi:hypothetical protein
MHGILIKWFVYVMGSLNEWTAWSEIDSSVWVITVGLILKVIELSENDRN